MTGRYKTILVVLTLFIAVSWDLPAQEACAGTPGINIPSRPENAPGGDAFYEQIRALDLLAREAAIVEAFLQGNLPEALRRAVYIETEQADKNGKLHRVGFWALPDYLAVGSDADFFRIPMSPLAAQAIADAFQASMPTPKMVDLIYQAAKCKLDPFPYKPRGSRSEGMDIFHDHSRVISAQQFASGVAFGVLTAGAKKDLVISSRLADTARANHVTIYGWHRLDGKAIQPTNNVHINNYIDYSHGVRLVSNKICVDGQLFLLEDLLKDPLYFCLLSGESQPLQRTNYRGDNWHNE